MSGEGAQAAEGPWRVGQHYGIHVYEGDRPVATFHREEDATRAVAAVNAAIPVPPEAMTRAVIEGLRETVYGLLSEPEIRWYDQAGMERLARTALMVTELDKARAVAEARREEQARVSREGGPR